MMITFETILKDLEECTDVLQALSDDIEKIGQIELPSADATWKRVKWLHFLDLYLSYIRRLNRFFSANLKKESDHDLMFSLTRQYIDIYAKLIYVLKKGISDEDALMKILWSDLYVTALIMKEKAFKDKNFLLSYRIWMSLNSGKSFPSLPDLVKIINGAELGQKTEQAKLRKLKSTYQFPIGKIINDYWGDDIITTKDARHFYAVLSEQTHTNALLGIEAGDETHPRYRILTLVLLMNTKVMNAFATELNLQKGRIQEINENIQQKRSELTELWKAALA